jgi:hypothetical protein
MKTKRGMTFSIGAGLPIKDLPIKEARPPNVPLKGQS